MERLESNISIPCLQNSPQNFLLILILLEVYCDRFGSPDVAPSMSPLHPQNRNISSNAEVDPKDLPDPALYELRPVLLVLHDGDPVEDKIVLPRLVQLPKLVL